MNEPTSVNPPSKWLWLRILLNTVVCGGVLTAAAYAAVWINQTEPTAQKVNNTRKSAALVETVVVRRSTCHPRLSVLGNVRAAQQISLSPRVSGEIIEMSAQFVPGGLVKKGDLLMRIDPADYQNAIAIRKSELEKAKAAKKIEMARQRLAEKELKLLEKSIDQSNRSLIMREPQLASIDADIDSAKAAISRAQLDLQRTEIFAPFDAQVLSQSVNIGSQVSPGNELGQLVGLDEYWIMAAVPMRHLKWVKFPAEDSTDSNGNAEGGLKERAMELERELQNTGSKVALRSPQTWGRSVQRTGYVAKLVGNLDQQTRLAQVLITVKDPLGKSSQSPPLILGTLIETEIEGRPIQDVVQIERKFVRDRDTVWVMKNGKLEIRKVQIVFRDTLYAYIQNGLEDGEEVVTTNLATVAAGIGLRKAQHQPSAENSESSTDSSKGVSQ